jgi:hypothetical protein
MQLVALKSCLAQHNYSYISKFFSRYTVVPTAHAVHRAHVYILVHSSSLALSPAGLGKAAGAGPAGARFAAPPPPRPTCTAGRGAEALPGGHRHRLDAFGVGVGVCIAAAAVGRRRWRRRLWLWLDSLTKFEFSNLYYSTCSLHVQDVLVVLRQQGL